MKEFIKGVFTDKDGSPSSKRVILFLFVVVFVSCVIVNISTGKDLETTLKSQLFYLIIYALAAVFGENITKAFGDRPKDPPPNP